MKVTWKIEGVSELVDGLRNELPKATSANVQRRALTRAAEPMRNDAQSSAPVETGLLRKKITVGTKLSPAAKRSHKKESKVEIFVGPPSMPRAIVAEFGSVYQTPRPFMRPAWDGNKRNAFDNIKVVLLEEMDKARQRIARKTARQLAKLNRG